MQAAGIRAFVGKLSMDISSRPSYVEASTQDALSSVESFVQKCRAIVSHLPEHKQLVEPVITPRFVPTCSDNLLTGLGTISESQSIRIQSHLAEAYDQVEWVKRERGVDDIDVFDRVRNCSHVTRRNNAQVDFSISSSHLEPSKLTVRFLNLPPCHICVHAVQP